MDQSHGVGALVDPLAGAATGVITESPLPSRLVR
jgi:hypothetical protein